MTRRPTTSPRPRRGRAVVIGAGHWQLPLYRDALVAEHDLIGVSDPDERRARAAATDLGARHWTNWELMVDRLRWVEIAYVLGRHDSMAAVAHGLIDRRIPFVLAAPGGVSLADLCAVEDAAFSTGVPVATPLLQRLGPIVEVIPRLGPLETLTVTVVDNPPARSESDIRTPDDTWTLDPASAGGGCLAQLGAQYADLLVLASRIDPARARVHGTVSNARFGLRVEDHAVVSYTAPGGALCSLEVAWAHADTRQQPGVRCTLTGRDGVATIDAGTVQIRSAGRPPERFSADLRDSALHPVFVRRVADSLEAGLPGLPGLPALRGAMELLQRAYADAVGIEQRPAERWLCGPLPRG